MGIFDGAANGLKQRLEEAEVPSPIGYAIGQAAYISARKRHSAIPDPVVSKSEVTWLVSQYETQLRLVQDPAAIAAMVQGLCMHVFGDNAERVFVMGYPGLSAERLAAAAQQEQSNEVAESWLAGMLRYFGTADPAFRDDRVMLTATYIYVEGEEEQRWHGSIILWDGYFGFFEEGDVLAETVNDGSPILFPLRDVERCTVLKPVHLDLTNLSYINVQGESANLPFTIRYDGNQPLCFAVWLEGMPAERSVIAIQDIYRFLGVMDKALAFNAYKPNV